MKKFFSKINIITKKFIIFTMCGIILLGLTHTSVHAAYQDKVARASHKGYSWCGVHIYTCGVEGDYSTNGNKIRYSSVNPKHYTFVSWGYKNAAAKWTRKDKTSGTCKGTGTFYQGISTEWIDLRITTIDESVYASASK